MKVNYLKNWDNKGNCYRQTVTVDMDSFALQYLNNKVSEFKSQLRYGDVLDGHCVVPENLIKLQFGVNYLSLTQFVVLKRIFGWDKEKRVLCDRNTILKINKREL